MNVILNKRTMRGGLSLLSIFVLVIIAISATYYYIDMQADTKAEQALNTFIEQAKSRGVTIDYGSIDASPFSQSVNVHRLKITSLEQEPDISIENIVVTDLNWQDSQGKDTRFPLAINIKITGGKLLIGDAVIGDDQDIQTFVTIMGNEIGFSGSLAYTLNESTGELRLSLAQSINDNVASQSELSLGNMGWLAYIDATESLTSDNLSLDLLATTLNSLSVTIENEGLLEKIQAIAVKRSGKSKEQLVQQSITQMRQLQLSVQDWGPSFIPMIEQLIVFMQQPTQLTININPAQPLVSNDFIKAFLGGQDSLLELIEKSALTIRANDTRKQ